MLLCLFLERGKKGLKLPTFPINTEYHYYIPQAQRLTVTRSKSIKQAQKMRKNLKCWHESLWSTAAAVGPWSELADAKL